MPYTAQTQHLTATAIMSALLLIKDIAEGVVDGSFIGGACALIIYVIFSMYSHTGVGCQ